MSTPIFDQLVAEFAARGKLWESMTTPDRSKPPVFKGITPTVSQLDEAQTHSTAPVAVPMDVLKAVKGNDDTMSLPVIKPIAVIDLHKRGAA